VWNLYGITETTVHATVRELTAADVSGGSAASPIGVPLSDLSFAVVEGELWISGPGVARGYVNRPELTAERFVDAVVDGVSGRWYRTGDAVRQTASEFEYVGRLDRQVQLRGFRIELGEVETALAACDGIGTAAVELVDDGDGPSLAAFVTAASDAVGTLEDVREALLACLPEYMVPSSFSVVASMPMTANGKLDREALRTLDGQPLPARGGGSEPLTDTERQLAEIWSEVLGVSPVGRDEYFFTIGGNSMLALRLVALISKTVGTRVGIATLYRHPTIAELAEWVDAAREKAAGAGR
jgi:acyl-coenzyme A synthetase/AMP-(fatty) acid ligase